MIRLHAIFSLFFNDTATTEIYTYGHTLSLHDALPIWSALVSTMRNSRRAVLPISSFSAAGSSSPGTCTTTRRSEEHTSELQSLMRISYAVFCLKKKMQNHITT